MSWAVGESEGRHIGYGVPATCDQPGCGAAIDRGLGYACGGGVMGDENCGLFFCSAHLYDDDRRDDSHSVCEQCLCDLPPFEPTPDTEEWVVHVLTDPSWAPWRKENPERVAWYSSVFCRR